MRVYYKLLGGHYHCRVFMNGGLCGTLVSRESEWMDFKTSFGWTVEFVEDE